MRVPLLLLLLAPALAAAQSTLTLSYANTPANVRTRTVGAGACDSTVIVNYTVTSSQTGFCSDLELWLTTKANCNAGPETGDFTFKTVAQADIQNGQQQTAQFEVRNIPGLRAGENEGCVKDVTTTFQVCARTSTLDSTRQTQCQSDPEDNLVLRATPLKLVYDAEPPNKPSIVGAVGELDQELRVTVEADNSATRVRVEARVAGTETVAARNEVVRDVRTVSLTGLKNGTTYELRAFALDAADNVSPASEPVLGTPVETEGFWGAYKNAGGQEQGGCSSAAGLLAPVAVLAVAFLRRRRS